MSPAMSKRFQFRPGMHRPHHMRNGAIVMALLVGLLYFLYTSGNIPFLPQGSRNIEAIFASAANVRAGKTPIRVKGVPVGDVTDVQRTADGKAVKVTMNITDDSVKLHDNARADIYWRTLLGFGFYIQLDPGSSPQMLGERPIPLSRTSVQTELDQVLASLTPPSRQGMQQMFRQLSAGFGDTNAAGTAIDRVAPAMTEAAPGISALRGTRPGDITTTVESANRLLGVLRQSDNTLGALVDNGNATLATTARRRADIASTLQNGPASLDSTQATMTQVDGLLGHLDPVAESLRPGVRTLAPASDALEPALAQLRPLLATARPTLAQLRPALTHLGTASRAGVPLLAALDPTLDRVNGQILPGFRQKGDVGVTIPEALGPTLAAVSSSSDQYDANGYTQTFQAVAGSTQALQFLPCGIDPNLQKLKLSCDDLKAVIGPALGLPAPAKKKGAH